MTNEPVNTTGNFCWDILRIFHEIKSSISKCVLSDDKNIKSIGIDTWGVDYGFIDKNGALMANPYNELLDFVRDARFERLGAFKYSEEEGTYGAENLKDSISSRVKQERLDELMTLQSEISYDFNQSRVGSEIKVIVDDFTDGVYVCRREFESPEVDGEILVRHDSSVMGDVDPYSLIGEFITVKVTGADEYDLIAEPIEI